jgi:protein O-mannosyl-transferase
MLPTEGIKPRPLLMQGFFLILITLTYYWISLPGLAGGFILDDLPNLEGLDQAYTNHNLSQFIFSGIASELGRPISLLSFALQAEHWPQNPYPFKLAGLCIHIANAWLVYVCCHLIGQLKNWPPRSIFLFAGTVFSLWLFHPLNISTVFYVVQRMVLLAGFFSLLGIASFLWCIKRYHQQASKFYLALATLGMAITYVLGILSKENAILTGLMLSVLYVFLLRVRCGNILWDAWVIIFGVLPSLLVLGYLSLHITQHTRPDFGPFERLLTESVILQDYLDKTLLPTPKKLNIFNDGFPVYKHLFDSTATLISVSFWLVLSALALILRKRAAFLAFGLFWFLSGHLLESSIFGLELYFEHRNYLPSLGILIGIVGTIIELNLKAVDFSNTAKKWLNYASTGLLFSMATAYVLVYGAEISTWRSPGALAISALTERPESLRAHQEAAAYFANVGNYANSTLLVQSIEKKWPGYPGTYSQLIMLHCLDNHVVLPNDTTLKQRLVNGKFDRGTIDAWHQILDFKKNGHCPDLTWAHYQELVELLIKNKNYGGQKDDFVVLLALSFNANRQFTEAASAFDKFPEDRATLDFLILKAQFYAMAGKKQESQHILERAKNKFSNNLKVWLPRQDQLERLQQQVLDSIKTEQGKVER